MIAFKGSGSRFGRRGLLGALALLLTATLLGPVPALARPTATISGSFDDSCRDFEAHSRHESRSEPKDISHVEIHYADGRVVKEETVGSPDFLIDGGPGGEIDFAIVKSGTTSETFTCQATTSPPTAVIERKAGSFDPQHAPGTWTSADCQGPSCYYAITDGPHVPVPDESAVSFRGTSSTDPDNDIVSWSIDFGDGTTPASGNWITEPPVEVIHDYNIECYCAAVLTVTDSAGHTSSDSMVVTVIFWQTAD